MHVCVCICVYVNVYCCSILLILMPRKENALLSFWQKSAETRFTLISALGLNVVRLPRLPFQRQFNGIHHTRSSPGGKLHIAPMCHGGSTLTSSIGYTHPGMAVSGQWCGSWACLFFGNPLKVALNRSAPKSLSAITGALWLEFGSGGFVNRGPALPPLLGYSVLCNLKKVF